jgi:hypothetical protein
MVSSEPSCAAKAIDWWWNDMNRQLGLPTEDSALGGHEY